MGAEVTHAEILAVIVGMALVNFALRYTPMLVLSRRTLPEPVLVWLSYVPISVMGALVATEVLRPGGEWVTPAGANPGIPAALLTAAVFRLTRSFLGATVAGMVSYVVLRSVM